MEYFEIKNLYKNINSFELNIEKLKILKNCVNVVIGENGAGKSTLLNMLIEENTTLEKYKKALLTQTSYTFNRSCLKNVQMVLKWNGLKSNPIEFLQIVGLEDKKDIVGKNLSGGEKKRLAFAMALATGADIILLDEPFANLDIKNQNKLIEIIKDLKGSKTVIIVSHRINICKGIGDYFTLLDSGNIVKSGLINSFSVENIID